MANIIIYTKPTCPFCHKAKGYFQNLGIPFQEISIAADETLREEMITRSGRKTVPQIFINETHIGGCDDLFAKDAKGQIKPMLNP